MHCVGFNVMPRRILDFPDTLNSWNYISSLGSLTTLMSFFLIRTCNTMLRYQGCLKSSVSYVQSMLPATA